MTPQEKRKAGIIKRGGIEKKKLMVKGGKSGSHLGLGFGGGWGGGGGGGGVGVGVCGVGWGGVGEL